MHKTTEKAVLRESEKEMFETKDNKPALPLLVRLAKILRSKLWQKSKIQR